MCLIAYRGAITTTIGITIIKEEKGRERKSNIFHVYWLKRTERRKERMPVSAMVIQNKKKHV